MALLSQDAYYFRPGRASRTKKAPPPGLAPGSTPPHLLRKKVTNMVNPGILILKGRHQFVCNKPNEAWTKFLYSCKYSRTPGIRCTSKAIVSRTYQKDGLTEDKVLQFDEEHNHPANEAFVIAEQLKQDMVDIVRKAPEKAVSKAIKKVKEAAEEKYNNSEEGFLKWQDIVDEIGPDSAIKKRLLRARAKIIGTTPKSRENFYPKEFLDGVFNTHKVEIMDSNVDLDDNWEEEIAKKNLNSRRRWERDSEKLREYEDIDEGIVEDDCGECEKGVPHECHKEEDKDEGTEENHDDHEEALLRAFQQTRSAGAEAEGEQGAGAGGGKREGAAKGQGAGSKEHKKKTKTCSCIFQ